MLRLPSLISEFPLCFSGDPALDLPIVPELADGASEEVVKERNAALEEKTRKLRVARETGRWDQITKSGQTPTIFRFIPVHGTKLTWMQGERVRRNLDWQEGLELAFRIAIKEIDNIGKLELAFEIIDGQRLLKRECLDQLYDIGRDAGNPNLGRAVVLELGGFVVERAYQGVPPK